MAVEHERQALVALLEGEPHGALGSRIVNRMLRFAHELRGAGLVADPASVIEFARAMLAVGPTDREAVRAAGAVVFARSPEQVGRYEAIFDRFWRRGEEPRDASDYAPANASDREEEPEPSQGEQERPQGQPQEVEGSVGAGAEAAERAEPGAGDEEAEDESAAADASWSHLDVLRTRSFDQMSPDELREAALLVDRLRPALAMRRTRRVRLHDRGDTLAPRAMLRRSLSTGGDLLYWRWRRPVVRTRPVIILCDISGSMERYSRLLLRFSHALMQSDVPVEAFAFGTRLTRVTRELRRRNADAALEAASQTVHDWSGGTDIGRSLKTFNRIWGKRLPLGRSVVLIISDGWDRGSADVVAGETAWLQRSCHRLIWLNPLAGTPGYEPLTAGMAAALPHVDRFLACDSIADLEALGELLAENGLEAIPASISPLASPEPATPAARG